ncbi:MAG: hypothetical protein ACI8R4_004099 [Paracoccaceae bacterium]|jgi:hypothetical protein
MTRVGTWLRYVAVGVAVLAPVTVQAQDWWQGIWAFDPEWCAAADQIGSVTPAPIAITVTEVLGYENSCAITHATALDGVAAAHLQLRCQSEGDTYDEERLVMRTDETGLAIWIWFGSSDPVLFQRCE